MKTKKNKLMSFIAVLLVACIISTVSITPASIAAASHTHSDTCYPKSKHTHVGDSSKQGGCYSNIYDNVTCGTGYYDSSLSKSYSTGQNSGYTDFYARCNTCGSAFYICTAGGSPSGSYGTSPTTGVLYTHNKMVFRLACGMNETSLYAATKHVHSGVPTSQGGCYQGGYTSIPCSNTSSNASSGWTYYSHNTNAYSDCDNCGGRHGPGTTTTYKCNTCGAYGTEHGGYSTCYGNYYPGVSLGQHSSSGYALSCGKDDSSFYDCNGNIVTHICNKVVTALDGKK